jgi:hypothetical protein
MVLSVSGVVFHAGDYNKDRASRPKFFRAVLNHWKVPGKAPLPALN